MEVLDNEGLAYLYNKFLEILNTKQDIANAITMEQVNAAIDTAITSAIEETY